MGRRPTFGKKAIDKARILAVAKSISDRNGQNPDFVKLVAQELLVSSAYILKMFAGEDAMRDALGWKVLLELNDVLAEGVANRRGRDALEVYARLLRAYGQAHPTLLCVALRPARTDCDGFAAAQRGYLAIRERVLASYGLAPTVIREVASCVGAALEGFISAENAGRGATPLECDRGFERLLDMLDDAVMNVAAEESREPPRLRSYG